MDYTLITLVLLFSVAPQPIRAGEREPTADQAEIYRAMLAAARVGDFDGCPLRCRAELGRKAVASEVDVYISVSEMPKHFHEALEDYKSSVGEVLDVSCLGDSQITVVDHLHWDDKQGKIWLSHVGFDHAGAAAVSKIVYSCWETGGSCNRTVLVFLLRIVQGWVVTNYWVMENSWSEVRDIYRE